LKAFVALWIVATHVGKFAIGQCYVLYSSVKVEDLGIYLKVDFEGKGAQEMRHILNQWLRGEKLRSKMELCQ